MLWAFPHWAFPQYNMRTPGYNLPRAVLLGVIMLQCHARFYWE